MPDTLSDVPAFPMKRDCPFDPPPELSRIQAESPVSRVRRWDGSHPWLVTGYDDVRSVLADRRFSADVGRPGYPHVTAASEARRKRSRSLISMDEPEHGTYRKMLTSTFMIKKAEGLRPRIQSIVDGLIDTMLDGTPPADLVAALALPVPSLVSCELLGVPYADHDFFQARTTALVRRTTAPKDRQRAFDELRAYLDELITRKESDPGDDLYSRQIARQREEGTLDHPGLVSMAFLLLVAGHETTANMISLGVLGLLTHPGQLDALRQDPGRTPMAVEELLLYFSIVEMATTQKTTKDKKNNGVTIKADDGVVGSGLSANWD